MRSKVFVEGLAAMAHETRVALCKTLAKAGDEGLAGHELADRMGIARTLISHHLKILTQAGITAQERDGRFVRYRVDGKRLQALAVVLSQIRPDA